MLSFNDILFFPLRTLRKVFANSAVKCTLSFLLYSISASSQNSLIIAHRGASAYAPENTLSAFEKAIKMKAMAIETDVHQTKDSVLVLMHDESVDRTTNGKGLIKDMLFDDFKKLEIRSPLSVKTEHPPSLEEALALVHSRCQLLIEIKRASDYYPGIEKRLVELIKKCHAEHDIKAIHSFEKQALVNVAKVDSLIPLQKLIVFKLALGNLSFDKHFIKDDFKTWEGVNVHSRFCSKRIIRKLHRLGKTVYVWTVNDPKKAGKFVKRGVDGIITNDPDILNKKALIKSGL